MKNQIPLSSPQLAIFIGRLSWTIIALGFISLKIFGQNVYNGTDGVNSGEKIFLLWIVLGGALGAYAYALKKTVGSLLSLITAVIVQTTALGMALHE